MMSLFLIFILANIFVPILASGFDYSKYVNPFIGGEGPYQGYAYGGGDIFVGGALPFGVVKVGIDTYEKNLSLAVLNGGWQPFGNVTGISMLHVSGTGGPPKYGVIPQMPLTTIETPVNILDNTTYWQPRIGDDVASVGYFKTHLENDVIVELSAARHAGIMQYNFPAGDRYVLVDISHYLPSSEDVYTVQDFQGGQIQLVGNEYMGYGTFGGGWNEGAPWTVYFCGDFSITPDNSRTFRGRNTDPVQRAHTFSNGGPSQVVFGDDSETSGPLNDRIGALFSWNSTTTTSQIKSRVGISFISSEKACKFKNEEIPSWNLNDTVQAAVMEWNRDVFSKIQVPTDESADETNLILLYSSMYFSHLMPSDRTGENPLWESEEPYFDDFYAIWDIFRCTVSLYHLIQPLVYEKMIRALIDIWRWDGYMPDGRSGNYNGLVQGGSNADNILADAYIKGLRGAINWTDGYQAMVKDAEVVPYNTYSILDQTGGVKEGRGSLTDWLELGYVSLDRSSRCISKTVEYAANDYALSVLAAGEAPQDTQKYLNRSAGWQLIWNHNISSQGFTGFLTPKLSNGTWSDTDYNPGLCGGCSWSSITYEATPWEYSFTIPHDMKTLIEFMGGVSTFENRLDYIFKPNSSSQNLDTNGAGINTIMNIGNEPDFATPYLYNYINKQAKTVERSRSLGYQFFKNELYGVPGNSDAGALNSWLIWQMLGIYPVVSQPVYLLVSPWFEDINMTINGNRTLRITSVGLGPESYHVQSVKINGRQWNKNWFEHDDIMVEGGTIEFEVGRDMVQWETGEVPPSPGHVRL